jgi:fatty acid desaturase
MPATNHLSAKTDAARRPIPGPSPALALLDGSFRRSHSLKTHPNNLLARLLRLPPFFASYRYVHTYLGQTNRQEDGSQHCSRFQPTWSAQSSRWLAQNVSSGTPQASVIEANTDTLYRIPAVSWPAMAVLAFGLATWSTSLWLTATGRSSLWCGLLLSTVGAYALFTPVHEAVHGSLGRSRLLNTLFGNVVGPLLGPTSSFAAYRYLHLEHHRHTNDPKSDPDFWSGRGPAWSLPLRWLTQDFFYTAFYMTRSSTRSGSERIQTILVPALLFALYAASWPMGYGWVATFCWVLPGRVIAGLLSFTFNYLPHIPYAVRGEDDPYQATNVIAGMEVVMTPLFMGHNYHLIHHLYPGVPFYRYSQIWRRRSGELRSRGARVLEIQ